MKSIFFILLFAAGGYSCQVNPTSDKRHIKYENNIFRLKLNPAVGSTYSYHITNETEMNLQINDKDISNENKSTVGITYHIDKDSTGNLLFKMQYDKIQIKTKSSDTETEMDAMNASFSTNPVDKFLGMLKDANITATITPTGEVLELKGYNEIGEKLIAQFDSNDIAGKKIAQEQWQQFVGEKLVKNTFNQLFTIFPDSAVYIGDKWRLDSKQEGDFSMSVKNFFTLKDVQPELSIIESAGDITSDKTPTKLMGYDVVADLKGKQHGRYEMETKTGMLVNSKITADIEGTIQMMGREIPVTIKTTMKMSGTKNK